MKIDSVMTDRLNDIIKASKWAAEKAQTILDSGQVEYAQVTEIVNRLHNTAALTGFTTIQKGGL